MPELPRLSREVLDRSVRTLLHASNQAFAKSEERLRKNVIDPFSSIVIASVLEIDTSSYALATGSPTALQDVYDALVECIGEKLSADVKAECRRLFRASIPA